MSDTGKWERAYLVLTEPSTSAAKAGGGEHIKFSFNPKEFTMQRSAEWKSKPSKKPTMPEFTGTKPASLTLEMFLDASEGGDVSERIDKLFTCVDPHPKTTKDKPSPPFVSFGWGSRTYLEKAVIKTVSVKYTRFSSGGAPIRAVATITLEELRPADGRTNPSSGGLTALTSHTVVSGDTLASIAYQELGSPSLWRAVADANGITDTFRLRTGIRLIIPTPESSMGGR